MGSELNLKNGHSELSIIHRDGQPAKTIYTDGLTNAVDTVADMEALVTDSDTSAYDGNVCFVKDLDRGGTFIYDSVKASEDNQGTNFNGWIRQYDNTTVSIKWFGAKDTLIASNTNFDSTSAIQAAIDGIVTYGYSNVFIPRGVFKSNTLTCNWTDERQKPMKLFGINNKLTIEGEQSHISYIGASDGIMFNFVNDAQATARSEFTIEDLLISGNYSTGSSDTSIGLKLYRPTGLKLLNLSITGFHTGIKIDSYWYYSIFDGLKILSGYNGIDVNGGCNGSTLYRCSIGGMDNIGFSNSYFGQSLNIKSCWFEACKSYCIKASNGNQINLADCYIETGDSSSALFINGADSAQKLQANIKENVFSLTHTTGTADTPVIFDYSSGGAGYQLTFIDNFIQAAVDSVFTTVHRGAADFLDIRNTMFDIGYKVLDLVLQEAISWSSITLLNDWVNNDSNTEDLRYCIVDNIMYIQGNIDGTNASDNVFCNVPIEAQGRISPKAYTWFIACTNTDSARIRIDTNAIRSETLDIIYVNMVVPLRTYSY